MGNNSKSSVVYQGKIPGRVKYTFAFGALGKDLIYGMIATFSMIYFTDIIKVAPAFIGTMFFVAKIWDAFNDLFMGMIVDNTRSRFGKFVPWLVIGTLINAFVFVTVFTDFHLTGVKRRFITERRNLYNRTRQDTFMKSAVHRICGKWQYEVRSTASGVLYGFDR